MSSSSRQNGSGTGTPNAALASSSTPSEDIYRPLGKDISKSIRPLISLPSAASSSSIPELLSISQSAFTSKVLNKTISFNPGSQITTDEAKAVKGRKRHAGDPDALESARRAAGEKEETMRRLGVPNRKRRKRAVVDAGSELSYERLRPLHNLHVIYLTNLLSLPPASTPNLISTTPQIPSSDSLHSKLSKADFTGAELSISTSRNTSLAGISGFVIEETASTFRLLTTNSVVKVIPKNGTQFDVIFPAYSPPLPSTSNEAHEHPTNINQDEAKGEAYQSTIIPIAPDVMERYLASTPRISVPLLGTNFGFRSGDRAGRKFRPTQGGGGGSGWGEEWVKGDWADVLGLLDEDEGALRGRSGLRNAGGGMGEKRASGKAVKRKRGKSRRKDPPAFGALEVS